MKNLRGNSEGLWALSATVLTHIHFPRVMCLVETRRSYWWMESGLPQPALWGCMFPNKSEPESWPGIRHLLVTCLAPNSTLLEQSLGCSLHLALEVKNGIHPQRGSSSIPRSLDYERCHLEEHPPGFGPGCKHVCSWKSTGNISRLPNYVNHQIGKGVFMLLPGQKLPS